jgi:hypothetical protein
MTGIFKGVDARGYALVKTSFGTHRNTGSSVERETQVECYAPGELSMVYIGRKA